MKKECKHHKGQYTFGNNKFCKLCLLDLDLSKSRILNAFSRVDFDKVFKDFDTKPFRAK